MVQRALSDKTYLSLGLLSPLRPMEFSTKLHTIKSGWSIVNNEGSQGTKISPKILYFLVHVCSDGKGHNR